MIQIGCKNDLFTMFGPARVSIIQLTVCKSYYRMPNLTYDLWQLLANCAFLERCCCSGPNSLDATWDPETVEPAQFAVWSHLLYNNSCTLWRFHQRFWTLRLQRCVCGVALEVANGTSAPKFFGFPPACSSCVGLHGRIMSTFVFWDEVPW